LPFSPTSKFGISPGGFKPTQSAPVTINLRNSGIDLSAAASQLEEGQASNALNVRFTQGGVSTDYAMGNFGLPYAGAENKKILHIANYDTKAKKRFLMRLRSASWDRWNGVNWATLPGALTGTPSDLYTSLTAQDQFIAANAIDKLKVWDGNDAHAVADLSADAPIARYITKIGTRILAASIKVAGVENPFLAAWCADGIITDWTTAVFGAGSVEPPVEGIDRLPGFIRGLSTLQRGAVIYRQNTIQLATLTGIGAAPFKFSTLDFNHGTESPYSIKSGGMKTGDFFLGSDYMVYNYDGNMFYPIGMPIYERLRDAVADRSLVVGAIDFNEQEYHLAYPTASDTFLTESWVFNIKEFIRSQGQSLVWRRRTLPVHTISFGYGFLGVVNDPIVDTITDIVDSITIRVDDWANSYGPERILFGDDAGQVYQIDKTTPTVGTWESKEFLYDNNEVTVDRVRLKYIAKAASTVGVTVSHDGGVTYQNEKVYNLGVTASGDGEVTDTINSTGRSVMFRIRPLTGFCTINQLVASIQVRGQTNG
jgi:hypothetical protein